MLALFWFVFFVLMHQREKKMFQLANFQVGRPKRCCPTEGLLDVDLGLNIILYACRCVCVCVSPFNLQPATHSSPCCYSQDPWSIICSPFRPQRKTFFFSHQVILDNGISNCYSVTLCLH